jgi:hypothetical protein
MFPLLARLLVVVPLAVGLAAAQAQSPALASDNLGTFKGAKKVVIDHFGVEFITTLKARGQGGGSSANIDAKLEGVSDSAMQSLTDRAYQDTVTALTQAGFEVVPADELQAQPLYQSLMAKVAHDAPYVVDDTGAYSRIFAPAGMKAVFKSGADNRGTMGDRMDAFNSKYQGEFSDVAKGLGVYLVRFHYLASFGSTTASGGFLSSFTGKARAAIEAGPTLMAKSTLVQVISHEGARIFANSPRGGNANIWLENPLVVKADGFALEETTSADSKRSDGVANALSIGLNLLTGGRGASQTSNKTMVVKLTEENFSESYLRMIGQARDAFVEKLAAAR